MIYLVHDVVDINLSFGAYNAKISATIIILVKNLFHVGALRSFISMAKPVPKLMVDIITDQFSIRAMSTKCGVGVSMIRMRSKLTWSNIYSATVF